MKALKEIVQAMFIAIIVALMGGFFGIGFGHGMTKAGLHPTLIIVKVNQKSDAIAL